MSDRFDDAADDAAEAAAAAADDAAGSVTDAAGSVPPPPPPPAPPSGGAGGSNPWPWILGILAVAVIGLLVWNPWGSDTPDDTTTTAAEATTTTEAEATTTTEAEATTTTEGEEPEETTTTVAAGDFLACQVTDTGGIDDASFNATAWAGVERAGTELGAETVVLESQSEADYETHINSLINQGCDIIITVGFLLGDATQAAANANPEVPFSIVDFAYGPGAIENKNVLGQVFATEQAGFLAGYLAAATTETGVVGTFGGMNIPTVTVFMDGFVHGVNHHNAEKGTSVTVTGWDYASQQGLFTGNFDSEDDGRAFAQDLLDAGADIVMPVAGPVGRGSAALASEVGTDTLKIIGVDADQRLTDPNNAGVYLTSVMKYMDVTTFEAIRMVHDGTYAANGGFEPDTYRGDLENGGVGLAPFGDLAGVVSAETQAELDALAAAIIDGTITVPVGGA